MSSKWKASLVAFCAAAGAGAGADTGVSPAAWFSGGKAAVESAKQVKPAEGPARNVILFVGDGMGISTITAARIFEGQRDGNPGEENALAFEALPYRALVKTYNTNQQVPDSAGTMSAIMTGVKTKAGVISVDARVEPGNCASSKGRHLMTFLERAEIAGWSTGVVSTARLTHATPAAAYAHVPDRGWESDADLTEEARTGGCKDIARQLIEFPLGDGLEVALGGGRRAFLPQSIPDPEDEDETGERRDGRNLAEEWSARPGAAWVWSKWQLDAVDPEVDHLLGLFEHSHMEFEHERASDEAGEPSLTEMTAKALQILSRNGKGYFLMVEAARIDHAHHEGNAYRALTETVELSNAVRYAMEHTDPGKTLIIVTADHGLPLTMGGYPTRGNPILGKVVGNGDSGEPDGASRDALGLPYTTLGYPNGPGYTGATGDQPEGAKRFPHLVVDPRGVTKGRPDLDQVDTGDPDYLQESAVPLPFVTHSGEDVPVYARGPGAHWLMGTQEQNVIYHVMAAAARLAPD